MAVLGDPLDQAIVAKLTKDLDARWANVLPSLMSRVMRSRKVTMTSRYSIRSRLVPTGPRRGTTFTVSSSVGNSLS